jgi:hypothetical protein
VETVFTSRTHFLRFGFSSVIDEILPLSLRIQSKSPELIHVADWNHRDRHSSDGHLRGSGNWRTETNAENPAWEIFLFFRSKLAGKDKEGKERWLQFVSLQGFHKRQP